MLLHWQARVVGLIASALASVSACSRALPLGLDEFKRRMVCGREIYMGAYMVVITFRLQRHPASTLKAAGLLHDASQSTSQVLENLKNFGSQKDSYQLYLLLTRLTIARPATRQTQALIKISIHRIEGDTHPTGHTQTILSTYARQCKFKVCTVC